MSTTAGEYFSLLVVLLFSAVFAFHIKFPDTPKRVETTVLVITAVLFFFLCGVFLRR